MTACSAARFGISRIASRPHPAIVLTSIGTQRFVARDGGPRGVPVAKNSLSATGGSTINAMGGGHGLRAMAYPTFPAGHAALLASRTRRNAFVASHVTPMVDALLSPG